VNEDVVLEFAANVTEAVASIRELAAAAEELAGSAKAAADGVASVAAPAADASAAVKGVADSSTAAAAGADEVAGAAEKAAGSLGIYTDAAGRARLANGQFASSAQAAAAGAKEAGDAAASGAAKADAAGGAAAGGGLGKYKMALVGVGVGTALAIDGAVKFQAQTTRLVTSAGQSAAGLGQVQQGLLQLSSQTGTSTEQLAQGMYVVESAGQHGAAGLEVLKAAAQGARAENASLETVADAVSSAMADYHQPASAAADITTKLVAATSAGKTSFEQLAGAMPAILPVASAAHVSLNDILGDLASMTVHGMSAQQSAQNLADAIRHMQNPTSVQSKELALLGMNTTQLATDMKNSGLSGTINEISQRILNLMPPGASAVILQMKTALQGLAPPVQALGQQLINGQISMKDYNKAALELNGVQAKQAASFATLLGSTHQIGGAQVSGTQVMQNYGQAMAKAMGDATGLNVALMISGENSKTTAGAIKTVSSASVEAGNNVKGWGEITKTTSFQLSKAKDSAQAAGISLGMALLPAVNALLVPLASFLSLIAGNRAAAITFAVVIGGILAGALGIKLAGALKDAKEGVKVAGEGLEWLVGKLSGARAASEAATVATEAQTAVTEASVAGTEAQAVATEALTVAKEESVGATEAATAAQEGLDVAMDANPIGVIILAITALVAVFAILWTHSAAFRDFWIGVWKDIQGAALAAWHFLDNDVIHPIEAGISAVVSFIESHWKLLATILATVLLGPVGGLVVFLATHWKQVTADVSKLVSDVVGFFERLPGQILHFLEALPGAMLTIGRNIVQGLVNGIMSMGSFLVNSIESLIPSPIRSIVSSALGIFSPSTVFHQFGVHIVQGLVNGIRATVPQLYAVMGLVTGAVAGPGSSLAAAAIAPAGGTTVHATVPVTIQGSTSPAYTDPAFQQYMQAQVQEAVLRYGELNPGNGLTAAWGR
jgi:hypothetical protein